MRVLHLPARTPFARNLRDGGIAIVNGGSTAPIDASFGWLARNFDGQTFDVVHIHTTELAERDDIMRCLELCRESHVGLVATLHEEAPLFDRNAGEFGERLNLLKAAGTVFATPTEGCRRSLDERYGLDPDAVTVIPHGNVLPLDSPIWNETRSPHARFRFSIHGGFRPNKRLLDPVLNFAASPALRNGELAILTRAVSSEEYWLNRDLRAVIGIAMATDNIDLRFATATGDDDLARFVLASDAMILPYAWGSHSGQIELAADLGIPVVATRVGHYAEQCDINGMAEDGLVFWVDWSEANLFAHGVVILAAMEQVFRQGSRPANPLVRRPARAAERERILEAYRALYQQSRDVVAVTR